MVTYRLTQSADKKEYKWTLVEKGNEEEIKIITWKGTYTIDYPKPTSFYTELEWDKSKKSVKKYKFLKYPSNAPHILCKALWDDGFPPDCSWGLWHPLKKQWIKDEDVNNLSFVDDILQWVLKQSPIKEQFHKAHQEDRADVESTFVEIESLQKK